MQWQIERIFLSAEFHPDTDTEQTDTSTDVIVLFTNGQKYIASFFAYANIETLAQMHRDTGSYLKGKYFWAKGMLLIEECTRELITKVLEHLLEEGDFEQVFQKLNT